ncbi:hypothetical protein DV096_13635 [Bradymonadaceae bacterium TMQ3]|nr:hypothetical protein DV096_13635 [Bradymonadaceae bacterium TMQ3]
MEPFGESGGLFLCRAPQDEASVVVRDSRWRCHSFIPASLLDFALDALGVFIMREKAESSFCREQNERLGA